MMKRTNFANCIISGVLGFAVYNFLQTAISQRSMGYGIFCVIAVIAFTLNVVCGPDNSKK